MELFRADIHVHTVLSPCGDLEMSPVKVVKTAFDKGLNILGITDHNSTLHCELTRKLAGNYGILVLMGAEVTTKEEIHCLTFFETIDQLKEFQKFLDQHLPGIQNDPERFGYQLLVNEQEEILMTEERLLTAAIDASIDQTEAQVHALNGLFIPAHIDRTRFSICSQLGFIPPGLQADAFEVIGTDGLKMMESSGLSHKPLFKSSDAHYLDEIGKRSSQVAMEDLTFPAFRKAILKGKNAISW